MLLISLETAVPLSPSKSPSLAVELAVDPAPGGYRGAAQASLHHAESCYILYYLTLHIFVLQFVIR